MKGNLGEIASGIQRRRRVEGKSFGVVMEVLQRFSGATYKKDRYLQRRTWIPCEQTGLRRVTLKYRHSPTNNIQRQFERPMKNAAPSGHPENRHDLQTAR